MKKLIILALCSVPIAGCNSSSKLSFEPSRVFHAKAPVVITPDPMAASELAKTHPLIKKICDLAGGCDKVLVDCVKYDDTGNTNLRNETVWHVSVPGALFGTPLHALGGGSAFKSQMSKRQNGIDVAARDYLYWYGNQVGESPKEPTVYPHASPCSDQC